MYLFQRTGSANWYCRTGDRAHGDLRERSLGTSDKNQALINALPLIEAHKRSLVERRARFEKQWAHKLAPGRLHVIDGAQVLATDKELHYLDGAGAVIRTEPNGRMVTTFVAAGYAPLVVPAHIEIGDDVERPKVARKSDDDALFARYLAHGGRKQTGLDARAAHDAQSTWDLFRSLIGDKTLAKVTRDDGRALVSALETQGLKSATVRRKLKPLAAAINMAIGEGKFSGINPFVRVAPSRNDALERVPFDDSDVKLIKSKLGDLPDSRALLLRVLATTGMRLSEAFQITGEQSEKGVRYCVVGTKTANSKRRVPLPAALLPYLPKTIKGPLFAGAPATEGGALNKFIRRCGIADPSKVVHSFRHRAKDRLRAAACPLEIQYELLGHEIVTAASGYGAGSPVCLLRKWADKIGF